MITNYRRAGTLKVMITNYRRATGSHNFDTILQHVVRAYNEARHKAIGVSP
jgi:hypothetical protein